MGDRATIEVKDGERSVWLYTHWDGANAERLLRRALKKGWRWNDACYLTRIIFCEMVKHAHSEETGYGISPWPCESQYDQLLVDVDKQTVNGVSFETFITLVTAA